MLSFQQIIYFLITKLAKTLYYFIREFLKVFSATIFNKPYSDIEYTVLPSKKTIYVINSKVACSSIIFNLMKQAELKTNLSSAMNYHDIHNLGWKLGVKKNKLSKNQTKEYFKFTLVRNPFERVVSLYRNKIEKKDDRFFQFKWYLLGFIGAEISFNKFVSKIVQIDDKYAEAHIVSQHHIIDRCSGGINFIGKLENIDKDLAEVFERQDIPIMNTKVNKTGKYDYRSYYNKETVNLIFKRYKEDIVRFGYEKDYEKLLSFFEKS